VTHLQPQLSAHHNHARATDVHTGFIDKHLDPTASVKLCPLLDDESLADWRQLALNKIEAQGARRASGRWIFRDADTWKEAARVSSGRVGASLDTERVASLASNLSCDGNQRTRIHANARQRAFVHDRGEKMPRRSG
jgi:hypothetical protein